MYCVHATGSISVTSANSYGSATIQAGGTVAKVIDATGYVTRVTTSGSRQRFKVGVAFQPSAAVQFSSSVYAGEGTTVIGLTVFSANAITSPYDVYIYYTRAS